MTENKDSFEDYPMTRDYVDFNRLNLQHYLWKDQFGYLLNPKVPQDGQGLRIADVGTGTGVWLLDLSSQLDPSTELYGIDSDITQVGPKEWLPQNITLKQWDVFSDVPADLVSRFDIVHLRLFAWVVEEDPRPLIQNLLKILKPGGYLQWGEVDFGTMRIETSSPDVPTDNLRALWNTSIPKYTGSRPDWVTTLPRTFQDEGLEGVEADWRVEKMHTGIAIHWCNLIIHEMIANRLKTTSPGKATEIESLVRKAEVESRKGAMYRHDRVSVIGRKPLNS